MRSPNIFWGTDQICMANTNCTARQCSPLWKYFMECSINSPAPSLLTKYRVIGQRLKLLISRLFIGHHAVVWFPFGQHFVATRVVHLSKSTETSLNTESDQSGLYHQLLQLCTARKAWSDSDQAVRAVHSCNCWFIFMFGG